MLHDMGCRSTMTILGALKAPRARDASISPPVLISCGRAPGTRMTRSKRGLESSSLARSQSVTGVLFFRSRRTMTTSSAPENGIPATTTTPRKPLFAAAAVVVKAATGRAACDGRCVGWRVGWRVGRAVGWCVGCGAGAAPTYGASGTARSESKRGATTVGTSHAAGCCASWSASRSAVGVGAPGCTLRRANKATCRFMPERTPQYKASEAKTHRTAAKLRCVDAKLRLRR
mmetsp:Transcript_10811/g.38214  ORF Transcript_10811/g.38214 Transcript_10811/m.38214 type:complete len:231 (-) Transcript_10811:163-855(-)